MDQCAVGTRTGHHEKIANAFFVNRLSHRHIARLAAQLLERRADGIE